MLSVPELALEAHLAQGDQDGADTLTKTRLELIWRHVKVNAKLLQLEYDVLRGSHRIIVLAPPSYLMVIYEQQPGDQGDEVDKLLTGI